MLRFLIVERSQLFAMALFGAVALTGFGMSSTAHADPNVDASKTDALLIDSDGDGEADPGDTIRYTITISNNGNMNANGMSFSDALDNNTTLVAGSIKTTPLALDDAYSSLGNVGITVPAGSGVLANDVDPDGGAVSAIPIVGGLSTNLGDVDLAANGSFIYSPPAGFEGIDTFSYTMEDADGNTDTATVSIAISGLIWFVDAGASAGDGRLSSPFDDLAVTANSFDVNAADAAGDSIFVAEGSYNGGLTLLNNQLLIGDGSSSNLAAITGLTPPAFSTPLPTFSGNDPVVTGTGDGVIVGQNNTIRGLTIGSGSGAGIRGSNVGTLTITETSISGGGALDINTGILAVTLDALSASSSTDEGIRLASVLGTFSVVDPNGTVNVNNFAAVDITGTGGGLLVNATFASLTSTNSATRGLRLANLTSGSSFNGGSTTLTASTVDGVVLSNNAGSTFTFADLDINNSSTNQRGIFASTSGTINISDGDINGGSGRGVDIDGTNLSVTLASVTSIGGTTAGIDLNTTTGSFTVDGDGANISLGGNGSGGTISGKTGSNGTNNGIGVLLNNATSVTLRRMQLNDHQNFAIKGTSVNGFELSFSTIDGSNGTGANEDCVHFDNLSGTALIDDCDISGGFEDNIRVVNTTGTLNLSLTDSLIGTNGADGALIETRSSANATLTITGNDFTAAPSDLLQTNALNTSVMDLTLTDNAFSNNHGSILSGGGGVTISGGGGGSSVTVTYDIDNNSYRDAKGIALNVFKGSGGGSFEGEITRNDIGVTGVSLSGSSQAAGIRVRSNGTGTHTTLIDDNTVLQTNEAGIFLSGNDGSSTLNATVTNNTVGEAGSFAFAGIFIDCGALSSDTTFICADIGGTGNENSLVGSGGQFGLDFISATSTNATINMPGLAGGAAGVAGYIQGRNTGTPSVDAFGNYTGSGSSCPTPSLLLAISGDDDTPVVEEKEPTDNVVIVPTPIVAPVVTAVLSSAIKATANNSATTDVGGLRSGAPVNLTIGTLGPGKIIVITFDATIDSILSPPNTSVVCNQGTVSGSNFADELTDDPDVAGVGDPTCTDVEVHGACCLNSSCTIVSQFDCSDLGGEYFGDGTSCDPNPCPCADLNRDGSVNNEDFQIFLASFGRSFGDGSGLFNPDADLDGDDIVSFIDYQLWLECFRNFVGDPGAAPALALPGDYDADSIIDLNDYGYFWTCMMDSPPALAFPCTMQFDTDNDGVISMVDFAVLQRNIVVQEN